MSRTVKNRSRGSALIEFTMMFPVLIFMFFGTFDMGFYIYALISVENAAHVAALDTSAATAKSASTTLACTDVKAELSAMPNSSSFPSACNASPLQVTATQTTGPDGNTASKVTVAYKTLQLIPIPGLTGQLTITRAVVMRVRG